MKFWTWLKFLFHTCGYFRWEVGYGLTRLGIGRYEYAVCRECGKEKLDDVGQVILENFVKDLELYKE